MDAFFYYTELYDLYKGLFTDKQRAMFEDYFFENLTIDEIATNKKVSKNAVSKTIKQIKVELENYESVLSLNKYLKALENEFKNDEDILIRLAKYDNIIR